MWKRQQEQGSNPVGPTTNPLREASPAPAMPQAAGRTVNTERETGNSSIAHIGKSVKIKGELSGSEDLFIDGRVEGAIELREHHLTVGANGKVQANINARKVVIFGTVKGNIRATDSVAIRNSGSLVGDLIVSGVSIDEGAYFKGSIDIQKAGEAERNAAASKKMDSRSPGESQGKAAVAAAPRL